MPVELTAEKSPASRPVRIVRKGAMDRSGLEPEALAWAAACDFSGQPGRALLVPGRDGKVAAALFGAPEGGGFAPLSTGALARVLPEGDWHFADRPDDPHNAALGLVLGGYAFQRYRRNGGRSLRFAVPEGADAARVGRIADGVFLARDLVNTAANDLGPAELEEAARRLAAAHGAAVEVIAGDDLLARNFPMIHAVGRASSRAPRLIDLS